jgi:signal transduction histidine kinase/ActR/RegA family two-component response regulator
MTRGKSVVRHVAVVVLLALAAVSVGGYLIARTANRDEERRLLRERAGEVAAVLSSATRNSATTLGLLGDAYQALRAPGPGFTAAARSALKSGVSGVGVAALDGTQVVVRAAEGDSPPVGTVLTGAREQLARRALKERNVVTTLIHAPRSKLATIMVALGRPDGLVVYSQSVTQPTRPLPSTADSPFRELDVALYQSPTVKPDKLVITTTSALPLSGSIDARPIKIGVDSWLLVTSAKSPLAGSLARSVPWIILLGGLAIALGIAAIVRLLARRRDYAMALADSQTVELRRTLADLETARAAADAANRSKTVFLSRMSHELRTPLNAVLGFAQLLELEDLDDEQRESVTQILKGGRHLLELINEVLDISRIESGDLALSPEAVLVDDVLLEAIELMRPLAVHQSIELSSERHASCAEYVFADRQRLKQILLNLLSNAVKYNRVGGAIAVDCELTAPTRLRLKVTDTGPGIRTDQLELLFVPFERLGADRSRVEGTGIGLALSRRLAEAMGGSMGVESVVGQGSTFWVELPVVEGPIERYERLNGDSGEATPTSTGGRPHAVLYIEDNLANLRLVQRVMEKRTDVEIIPAMQGRLGLELAREHDPILILLDLHLPDIAGDVVLQQLCDDPATASIPVIVVSADATSGQTQRLLAAGASGYLSKPINVSELLRIVDDVVEEVGSLPNA